MKFAIFAIHIFGPERTLAVDLGPGLARVIDDPAASPKYADIAGFGFYHRHLLRFLKYFTRDQFLILEYERLLST